MNHDTGVTSQEKRIGARYILEIGIGLAIFLFTFLLLPDWWGTQQGSWQHLVLTILPLLPIVWVVLSVWRHLRRIDEMQRASIIRSLACGFGISMLTAVLIALLRGGGFDVPGAEWITFITGMLGWGIALPVCFVKTQL